MNQEQIIACLNLEESPTYLGAYICKSPKVNCDYRRFVGGLSGNQIHLCKRYKLLPENEIYDTKSKQIVSIPIKIEFPLPNKRTLEFILNSE